MMIRHIREIKNGRAVHDERGISLTAVMMITLMMGLLGVAALTMTGLENSMAGAIRMVEDAGLPHQIANHRRQHEADRE